MHSALAVLGRFFLAAIFFVSGFRKLEDPGAVATRLVAATAKADWLPPAVVTGVADAAPLLAWSAIVFEFLGAFCLVTGFKKEFGAALLILFLLPTTFLFHPVTDPAQQTQFLKNLAIMGGLLLVVSTAGHDGERGDA
jgi:putative oxidoreductase